MAEKLPLGQSAVHEAAQDLARVPIPPVQAPAVFAPRQRYGRFHLPRILDWAFATLNCLTVLVLIWYVEPKLQILAVENRDYHQARLLETQKLIQEMSTTYAASERRAEGQRRQAYSQLEEILRSITVDRKREHDEFRQTMAAVQALLRAHEIKDKSGEGGKP